MKRFWFESEGGLYQSLSRSTQMKEGGDALEDRLDLPGRCIGRFRKVRAIAESRRSNVAPRWRRSTVSRMGFVKHKLAVIRRHRTTQPRAH
jgi:hypothetical protein